MHFPDFILEGFFIRNIFIMKNLTDFRKTVETGVDPRPFVYRPMICSPLLAKRRDRRSHLEKQVVVSAFSAGHKKVQQLFLNQRQILS